MGFFVVVTCSENMHLAGHFLQLLFRLAPDMRGSELPTQAVHGIVSFNREGCRSGNKRRSSDQRRGCSYHTQRIWNETSRHPGTRLRGCLRQRTEGSSDDLRGLPISNMRVGPFCLFEVSATRSPSGLRIQSRQSKQSASPISCDATA